ncbi:hypothetical protein K4K54_004992 [Colletotrichum sp. SAR 10_86]|nr:hypothetical protein K4K54_004992 [Colletotrichum sp. SAR 10_86]
MGGSVFTAGDKPLNPPRMPPEVYERVKAECHAALRKIYLCVASPIEGPAKKDYGDIDILVALERSIVLGESHSDYPPFGKDGKKDACKAIQEAIGAPFLKVEKQTDHYAVRWSDTGTLAEGEDTSTSSPERYCQIDIAICDNLEQVHWKLFKHAHGDLWSILGTIIRPYGLTVDEESLWVRIVEMEKFDKKRARVLLTQDPYEILSFLGLAADSHIWESTFESLGDMYDSVRYSYADCVTLNHNVDQVSRKLELTSTFYARKFRSLIEKSSLGIASYALNADSYCHCRRTDT